MKHKYLLFLLFLLVVPVINSSAFVYNNPYVPQLKREVVSTQTGGGDTNYYNVTNNYNITQINQTHINQTIISNSSFNETYTNTLYYSISNPSGYISSYTETDPKFSTENLTLYNRLNDTLFCINRIEGNLSTIKPLVYNYSIIDQSYTDSKAYNHTLVIINQYGDLVYNHTLISNAYTDSKAYNYTLVQPNNVHTLSILNITGVDDNACTGTDKVSNVTFNNGVLSIVCTADSTGSASSTSVTNYTKVDTYTATLTAFNNTMNFTLSAGTNYTIDCDLLHNASANTVGIFWNTTYTGTTTFVRLSMDTWSGATAKVGFSTNQIGGAGLIGTGSGAAVIYTTHVDGIIKTNAGGTLGILTRPEVAGTVGLIGGSECTITSV